MTIIILNQRINLLKIRLLKCPDCNDLIREVDMKGHRHKECPKRICACPRAWEGCTELIQFKDIAKHTKLRCVSRLVSCRLNCGVSIQFRLREDHETTHCSKRPIECQNCKNSVISEDITDHLHNLCLERKIKCSIGCGCFFKAKDVKYHEENVIFVCINAYYIMIMMNFGRIHAISKFIFALALLIIMSIVTYILRYKY